MKVSLGEAPLGCRTHLQTSSRNCSEELGQQITRKKNVTMPRSLDLCMVSIASSCHLVLVFTSGR